MPMPFGDFPDPGPTALTNPRNNKNEQSVYCLPSQASWAADTRLQTKISVGLAVRQLSREVTGAMSHRTKLAHHTSKH